MIFLENQFRGAPEISPSIIEKPELLITEFALELAVFNYNFMLIKLI